MARRTEDIYFIACYKELKDFIEKHSNKVFYGRQLEIIFEEDYYHWITNRALRQLVQDGQIVSEKRDLSWGGSVTLYWAKSFRFYKREASTVIKYLEFISDQDITSAIGDHGELLTVEGFSRSGFVMVGRDVKEYNGKKWEASGHDLDFLFSKEGLLYGIEVKNTLGYIDEDEFKVKTAMCEFWDAIPVFVNRMLPKTWIWNLSKNGGFALVLKYQLYPRSYRKDVKVVSDALNLPLSCVRRYDDNTMKRFCDFHEKNVNR